MKPTFKYPMRPLRRFWKTGWLRSAGKARYTRAHFEDEHRRSRFWLPGDWFSSWQRRKKPRDGLSVPLRAQELGPSLRRWDSNQFFEPVQGSTKQLRLRARIVTYLIEIRCSNNDSLKSLQSTSILYPLCKMSRISTLIVNKVRKLSKS